MKSSNFKTALFVCLLVIVAILLAYKQVGAVIALIVFVVWKAAEK